MPKASEIVKIIDSYFYKNRTRTANVLSGPKRETWFSAECFAALAERRISKEGPLTYWGEVSHGTIAKKLNVKPNNGDPSKMPDIAAILPADGKKAVGTIIENKLVLAHEDPADILESLKEQMLNAEALWPGAPIIGLIFIAGVTHAVEKKYNKLLKKRTSEPTYKKFLNKMTTAVDNMFTGVPTFRWIEKGKVHRVFDEGHTEFAYPAMHFSLALCSIELSSAPLPAEDAVSGLAEDNQPQSPVHRTLRTRPKTPKPRLCSKWIQ